MIDKKLIDLLPEEISDEAAHHLVNFLYDLALMVESLYFGQIMRYWNENNAQSIQPPEILKNKTNPDDSF